MDFSISPTADHQDEMVRGDGGLEEEKEKEKEKEEEYEGEEEEGVEKEGEGEGKEEGWKRLTLDTAGWVAFGGGWGF